MCNSQLQHQLDCVEAQLQDRTEQLQEAQTQLRTLRCRSAEEVGISDMRIRALQSQVADAQQRAQLACCTGPQHLARGGVPSGQVNLPEMTVPRQLQACARADDATLQLRAREQDIVVLQDCLEAERKAREDVQLTLASVLKMHNELHIQLIEVWQHSNRCGNQVCST